MNDKYIVYFLSTTKKKMINFIQNELKKNGLLEIEPSYGNILTVLYESESMLTMNEIAKKTSKDKSTITVLVNKLCNLEYIEKVKCKNDKRITYIKLTEKANEIRDKYMQISNNLNKVVYKNFSEDEKEEFLRLLKKMNNNF
ncbi:MarR family winged helix-turn-helix transcriptional regulator [Clostridium sp. B9]|uniref:MarR family winged helix-turn-helix transcriptional regulator n=1 Tax=Clostridium sp. B9 TaxID=3423224 RepID=UPI003D2EBA1C